MALRLRIVGEQSSGLGEASTKVFGVHGGTIGRSRENDWILPDPERYLSGTHARLEFRAGSYVIVDMSSTALMSTTPASRSASSTSIRCRTAISCAWGTMSFA